VRAHEKSNRKHHGKAMGGFGEEKECGERVRRVENRNKKRAGNDGGRKKRPLGEGGA